MYAFQVIGPKPIYITYNNVVGPTVTNNVRKAKNPEVGKRLESNDKTSKVDKAASGSNSDGADSVQQIQVGTWSQSSDRELLRYTASAVKILQRHEYTSALKKTFFSIFINTLM
jgi:hypothetical protein